MGDIIKDMAFPKPEYSKSQVDKAGDILINDKSTQEEVERASNILSNWRACHGYPVNTFQATLRNRLIRLNLKKVIVAQRLKRRSTIISKLKRFKNMRLAQMQDIGGLRVVVNTIDEVNSLEGVYLSDKKFQHGLVHTDDYIQNPKDDGYRSIHLVYKYKNKLQPHYDGLLLELQIRTKLQHIWATAVETMGTYLGQVFKSGEGEKKWRDFFAITSSALAYQEQKPAVPKYAHLDKIKTFNSVTHIEKDIDALNRMEGFRFALTLIQKSKGKSSYYHLIILNSLKHTVHVTSYAKGDIKTAAKDYTTAEKNAVEGEEAVLVSAGNLQSLKRAYPNYFLDVKDFILRVQKIIEECKKLSQSIS